MKEITETQAIAKLKKAQLLIRETWSKCNSVCYQETDSIIKDIQEIKERLFENVTK